MKKNLSGLRFLVSTLLVLTAACVSDPGTRAARQPSRPEVARLESPVFASIDEAAVAGLIVAREHAPRASRQAIQIGTIRRVSGGFAYQPSVIADESLLDARPSVLRLRLMPDDVATYILHPRTGAADMDERNEALNASEKKLLGGADRSRPVYLLTPRLDIVRHARDQSGTRLANLRSMRNGMGDGSRTALVD
ncbi:MAG: hypothetical protein IPK00_17695 [Deltaproteobacteria bacterium]|nr:hypothetical protein [Deltaproteobacteria bacterium]